MLKSLRPVIWLVLVSFVAACASSSAPSYASIAGTYAVTLSAEELSAAGAGRTVQLAGEGSYQLELAQDGKARISLINAIGPSDVIVADYKLSGAQLTFSETGKTVSCSDEQAVGKYEWKLEGNSLTFALIDDPCDRRFLLATKAWERQP